MQKSFRLAAGDQIPALGLGTWKMPPEVAGPAVRAAIGLGYRQIDCAAIYGNEAAIGESLGQVFGAGLVRREELWITSKLWNDCHQPDDVRPALERTLRDLRLDWLDLYLIHWPVVHRPGVARAEDASGYLSLAQVPLEETWLAMEECRRAGLCRNIGVSNFSSRRIADLIEDTSIPPAVNQVELHPWLQQNQLLQECLDRRIVLMAYSPLGSPDRPDSMKQANEPVLLDDPVLRRIAGELSVTVSQLLLAWAIQRGTVAIPKSATPAHQAENLAALQIRLDPEHMEQIRGLDRHFRFVDGKFWECPGGPYTARELWDE